MRKSIIALLAVAALGTTACSVPAEGEESSGRQGGKGSSAKANKAKADPSVIGNWKIENFKTLQFGEQYDMFKSVKLNVRNVSDETDSPWLEIRLTNKKGDLVASYDCIGDEYEPGQGGPLDCSSLDDFAPFTEWEIKNAF